MTGAIRSLHCLYPRGLGLYSCGCTHGVGVTARLVTDNDWSRFLNFAKAFLPSGQMHIPPLTQDMLRRALRRLKPRAARGADGFSKRDLLCMSDHQCSQLLTFFNDLEAGRRDWPQQWLVGLVCCLKKPNDRQDAQGYRPICILSLAYRIWSGIRARQMLQWLSRKMPPESLGFMPEREAAQFWWALEAQIEVACQEDVEFAGYSTDVIKAFNCLPRAPIFQIAEWIGLPQPVLHPWRKFLSGLERRFMVRQSVGRPIRSTCGFPEGCALSTVSMSVVCLCLHAYFEAFSTGASPRSYVDNISCVASSVGELATGINLTNTFLNMLGLDTDSSKTYTWAVQPQQRQQLRHLRLNPLAHARELGGVLSFGRSVRNGALVSRCQDMSSLFGRLRRSASPLAVKLSVLPRKLWARALHGISGCPLGEAHLNSLRAAATKALGIHPAGTSSLLRLSICQPLEVDPGYYQLWACLTDLRRMLRSQPELLGTWQSFMAAFDGRLLHGPFSKLLSVLSEIGWRINGPPIVADEEGLEHNLLQVPEGLLKRLATRAWLRHVAQAHRHRKTMADLVGLDVMLLQADAHRLSPVDLARVSALRSGAFVFGACHAKFDLTKSGLCVHCHVPDDHEHRVCHCPVYSAERAPFSWVCEIWHSLPKCLSHHLLPPENPFLTEIRACLQGLADWTCAYASLSCSEDVQHLFTDGSCIFADWSELALAGWGLVNASSGQVLACGPVPGQQQTAPRAELYAAIAALRWGLRVKARICIWTDSAQVGEGVRALLAGDFRSPGDNMDLWDCIQGLVELFPGGWLFVQHVPSHLQPESSISPFEDWLICWNRHADTLAVQANLNRTASFRRLHENAMSWHLKHLAYLWALRGIYVGIASKDQQRCTSDPHDDEIEEIQASLPPVRVQLSTLADEVPLMWRPVARQQCPEFPYDFVEGLCELVFGHGDAPARDISWLELTFSVLELGRPLFPVRALTDDGWLAAEQVPLGCPKLTVAVQLRLVRTVLSRIVHALGLDSCLVFWLDLTDVGISFPCDGVRCSLETITLQSARRNIRLFGNGRSIRSVAALARFHP